MTRKTVNLPLDVWRRLRVRMAQEDTTIQELLIRIVNEYCDRPYPSEVGQPKRQVR